VASWFRPLRPWSFVPSLLAAVALLAALAGCNYTGDMNVQPIRGPYAEPYIPPPIPLGVSPSPSPSPGPLAYSVPTNPTPANYFPVPFASPGAGFLQAGSNPYVAVSPSPVGPNTPTAADAASIQRGMSLYRDTCQACHGANGKGQTLVGGWFQRNAGKPPADLTSPDVQSLPDSQIFDVITNGFGAMPALAKELSPAERWDVIHYLRSPSFPR